MPASDSSDSLGRWSEDQFETAAKQSVARGTDSGLPDGIRFLRGVAKLARIRVSKQDPEELGHLAVFLLHPRPPPDLMDSSERFPMLDNGITPITSRIWFVNPSVVTGTCTNIEHNVDDAQLFELIAQDWSLGHVPAVIFDPRASLSHARYYKDGLSDAEVYTSVPVGHSDPITLSSILEVVDQIHSDNLVSPPAQSGPGKLWEDGAKCWPVQQAEPSLPT